MFTFQCFSKLMRFLLLHGILILDATLPSKTDYNL
jgi:hypothetical protein